MRLHRLVSLKTVPSVPHRNLKGDALVRKSQGKQKDYDYHKDNNTFYLSWWLLVLLRRQRIPLFCCKLSEVTKNFKLAKIVCNFYLIYGLSWLNFYLTWGCVYTIRYLCLDSNQYLASEFLGIRCLPQKFSQVSSMVI